MDFNAEQLQQVFELLGITGLAGVSAAVIYVLGRLVRIGVTGVNSFFNVTDAKTKRVVLIIVSVLVALAWLFKDNYIVQVIAFIIAVAAIASGKYTDKEDDAAAFVENIINDASQEVVDTSNIPTLGVEADGTIVKEIPKDENFQKEFTSQ